MLRIFLKKQKKVLKVAVLINKLSALINIRMRTMFLFAHSLFTFLLISINGVFAQEKNISHVYQYAREVVDTMASFSMHGRGYVNDGDKIAANYISEEFKKLALLSFTKDYYQKFNFPVNTFPNTISLAVDDKKLVPGKDFIIAPNCPSAIGKYNVVVADEGLAQKKRKFKKFLKQDFKDKIILVNDTGKQTKELHSLLSNPCHANAIVSIRDKLTWSVSQSPIHYPSIELLRTSVLSAKEISFEIQNKFIADHPSQNVVGYIKGSLHPDSFIVFSAHYDHLGQMGKDVYFPGANDNASGCAMLLNLAKWYTAPANKPQKSIVFIAFAGEEAGLLGSKYFTEAPLMPLNNICFLLNMDILGTGEEGITVVNGSVFKNEFNKLVKINDQNHFIKEIKMRGKAANSDHYYFSEKGVKAFFIYTMGGINAYHDIYDRPETLPLNKFDSLFNLITLFCSSL